MLPVRSNNLSSAQISNNLSDQSLINYNIEHAKPEELKELLNRCLTMNQLELIKNRTGVNWSIQEFTWINNRIIFLGLLQSEKEKSIIPIDLVMLVQYAHAGAEGGVRFVSIMAANDYQQLNLTNILLEPNQAKSNAPVDINDENDLEQ